MPYQLLPRYLDSYGLPGAISQGSPLNMGDACADYFTVLATTDMADDKSEMFWSPSNTPRRHPDTTKWWGQPHEESRDQLIPILCAAAVRPGAVAPGFLSKLFWSHARRLFLIAWNTRSTSSPYTAFNWPDLTGPDVWSLWLRIYRPFGYRLILPLLDLYALGSAVQWKLRPPDNVSRNFLLTLLATKSSPTLASKLALRITNVPKLASMWNTNTEVCGEYPTGPLIQAALESTSFRS